MRKNKWTKMQEKIYESVCLDDFDEEECYSIVERFDNNDWDDGIPDEERYV